MLECWSKYKYSEVEYQPKEPANIGKYWSIESQSPIENTWQKCQIWHPGEHRTFWPSTHETNINDGIDPIYRQKWQV